VTRSANGGRKAALEVSLQGQIVGTAQMRHGVIATHVVGANLFDLVPADYRVRLQDVLARVRVGGRAETGEIPFTAMEKANWWLRHIAPVRPGGQVRKFLVVCHERSPEDAVAGTGQPVGGPYLDRVQALLTSLRRNLEFIRGQAQEAKAALWIELLVEMEKACDEASALLASDRAPARDVTKWTEVPASPMAGPPLPAEPVPSRESAKPSPRWTVLVADDDPFARGELERILTGLGHGVVMASNGAEAIEKFATEDGKLDLVLLDTNMPMMGALGVLPGLRAADPKVKVVILCNHDGDGALDRLRSAGVDGFLRKPVTKKAVSALLAHVLTPTAVS
jgi:CheY-like chemotaxis protein